MVAVASLVAASVPLLLRGGGISGYGFNGAVYLSTSIHLVHGVLPYRDYVLLQPPGITVLLSPLGLLSLLTGSPTTWAVARVVMIVVTSANCVLVAVLLRRWGPVATLTGGLFLASFSLAGLVDSQVKLEPFFVFLTLLGCLALFGETAEVMVSRSLLAGILLGLAGTIKLWAVFPAAVLLALVVWRGREGVARFLAGLVAGFCVPVLPFVVVAPRAFFHDVVTTQLRRQVAAGQRVGALDRLQGLGYDALRGLSPTPAIGACLGAVVVAAVIVGLWQRRRSLRALECFAAGSSLLMVAALLLPAEYFAYYAYVPAAFFALLLGSSAAEAARVVDGRAGAKGWDRRRLLAGTVALALLLSAAYFVAQLRTTAQALATSRPPGAAALIAAVVPPGACVVSNDAYPLLMADRLSAVRRGCPVVVDAEGLWLSLAPSLPPPAAAGSVPEVTAAWRSAFAGASYVVLNRYGDSYVPLTPALTAWFDAHFIQVASDGALRIYRLRAGVG